MNAPDLAIVVVNWNVRDLVIASLGSARTAIDSANLDGEIWVVDNASSDGSVRVLQEWFRDIRLIPSPINLGFGGGNNLALRAMGFAETPVSPAIRVNGSEMHIGEEHLAIGERRPLPRYVLFLNPDTVVRPDALGELVQFMDRHPRAGVCSPRLVYEDGRFQHSAYRFPSLLQAFFDFWPLNWRLTESFLNGRYSRRRYEDGAPFPIDHPLGAAMLFSRQAIEQTGGFDLAYHMYVEEIDWCMRVKRAGWEIFCVPGAEIVHYEGQSTRQVRPQMVVALWRSRYILFEKHYSTLYRFAVRQIVRAGMRAQIRRARDALQQGKLDAADASALIEAYRQVIQM